MKKLIGLAVIFSLGVMFHAYVVVPAESFAVRSLIETEQTADDYNARYDYVSAKRDWVEAEMAGEQGYLQTQALRIESHELRSIAGRYVERSWWLRSFCEKSHLI